jgi:hydroxyethylthiazole kinase
LDYSIEKILPKIKKMKPLIHCITNHISITDCANIVLAVGGKPIMAEHPSECAKITTLAKTFLLNLGNINDTRMKSGLISAQAARANGIPFIVDLVGVACSTLRLEYSLSLTKKLSPDVIKGNASEIKAFAGMKSNAIGVDAGDSDLKELDLVAQGLAKKYSSVIMITGENDYISNGSSTFIIRNGTEKLCDITGTGCMLGALTATFLSCASSLDACVCAAAFMGVCGELAASHEGIGSFKTALFDSFYTTGGKEISDRAIVEKIEVKNEGF